MNSSRLSSWVRSLTRASTVAQRLAEHPVRRRRRPAQAWRGALHPSAPWRSRSSSTSKWPATLASNGNWCSRRSQKAWIVWILSPPGVSSARANSRRASATLPASGARPRSPAISAASSASASVVQRREFGEHALRHLGGGGLGEGQAEDARRIGAGEQQADDAARQDEGLARAGIGRDPGRARRVGCLRLRGARVASICSSA